MSHIFRKAKGSNIYFTLIVNNNFDSLREKKKKRKEKKKKRKKKTISQNYSISSKKTWTV